MTELEGIICYWKGKLSNNQHLLDVTSKKFLERTIAFLEDLQAIKEMRA